jgi:hypothetical protein
MIWLSVNLDCFIAELSSSMVENSTSDPVYLQGVLPRKLACCAPSSRLNQGHLQHSQPQAMETRQKACARPSACAALLGIAAEAGALEKYSQWDA